MKSFKPIIGITIGSLAFILFISCINPRNNTNVPKTSYKVTFIELGSVRCIPCRQMRSVMKSVEEQYADQVKVVFLDENGKEYFRHMGYFPEEELVKILNMKGVK